MLIHELKWNDGALLEDLAIWGVTPIRRFLRVMEEYLQDESEDDDHLDWMLIEMRDRLIGLESVIRRLSREGVYQRRATPHGKPTQPRQGQTGGGLSPC